MKIGDRIEELHHLRNQIRVDEAAIKELKQEFETKQWELMQLMEEAGLDQAKSSSATVFLSKDTVPTVKDWDALEKYIKDNDSLHLLQRRVSATAYRELAEMGTKIPGVEPFDRQKLNIRAI